MPVELPHPVDVDDAASLITESTAALAFRQGGLEGEYFIQLGETPEQSVNTLKEIISENYDVEPVVTGLRVDPEATGSASDLQNQAAELPTVSASSQTPTVETLPDAESIPEAPQARVAAETGAYAPSKVVSRAYDSGNNTVTFNQQYSWNDTTNKSANLNSDWGIELEFSLYNDAVGNRTRPDCPSGTDDNFWAGRGVAGNNEVLLWSAVSATSSDSGMEAYFDGFDASDPCSTNGFDIGIGYPQRISPTSSVIAELATLIVTEKGVQPSSKFSSRYQAVKDECFGARRTSLCMNLNLLGTANWPGPAASNGPFFSVDRGKYVQGGYNYNQGTAEYIADCVVNGRFGDRYFALGGGNGALGRCDSPEYIRFPTAPYEHRVQDFLNGKMYAKPSSAATLGPFEVYGQIGSKYEAGLRNPGPQGIMGWPTSGELGTPNGQGRFNRFENGIIYFGFPVGRAHAVNGAILVRYGQEGYEGGRFGFPTSDEFDVAGGKQTNFQGGWIKWIAATGQTVTS